MKFIVDRNKLLQAMQHTKMDMRPDAYLWKNHFQMSVQDDTLTVTGTNGEMFLTEVVKLEWPATNVRPTPFCVHNSIIKATKSLEQQPLEFTIDEYQLTVRHSSGYFRVPLTDTPFPEPKPLEEDAVHVHMEAPGLYSQLSKVSFATADDELRPVLSGVFVEVESEHINFVATNGHMLVVLKKHCKEPNERTCTFIIPRKVADTIMKILPKTGYCELYCLNNVARLIIEDTLTVDFRCIDGRYPNWRSVIPTEFNSVFSVDRVQLLKTVSRLLLFSTYSTRSVKFALGKAGADHLTLSTKCINEDTIAQENVSCEFTKGSDKFKDGILIKIQLLTKILSKVPSERVVFHTIDSSSAVVIVPKTSSDIEELTALVMPLVQSDTDNFESL